MFSPSNSDGLFADNTYEETPESRKKSEKYQSKETIKKGAILTLALYEFAS
jgi:hypothetical protein